MYIKVKEVYFYNIGLDLQGRIDNTEILVKIAEVVECIPNLFGNY